MTLSVQQVTVYQIVYSMRDSGGIHYHLWTLNDTYSTPSVQQVTAYQIVYSMRNALSRVVTTRQIVYTAFRADLYAMHCNDRATKY